MKKTFKPALRFHFLTYLYDPLMKFTRADKFISEALLSQAKIGSNDVVLDFGCGTGNLLLMMQSVAPKGAIYGVDIDSNILSLAKKKIAASDGEIFLSQYDGISLPYPNKMFHKILSSLVFHHLSLEQKLTALNELYRVLKSSGELHILDLGEAQHFWERALVLPIRLFDGFANTAHNVEGVLPGLISRAGFENVSETRRMLTPLGALSLYKGKKPTQGGLSLEN